MGGSKKRRGGGRLWLCLAPEPVGGHHVDGGGDADAAAGRAPGGTFNLKGL